MIAAFHIAALAALGFSTLHWSDSTPANRTIRIAMMLCTCWAAVVVAIDWLPR